LFIHFTKLNNISCKRICRDSAKEILHFSYQLEMILKGISFPFLFLLFTSYLNSMDITITSFIISALAFLLSLTALIKVARAATPKESESKFNSIPLRLQAYERLVLLTERISLPNLISRLNKPGVSAVEMKKMLVENIKQEFEYNSTQQLYVGQNSWDAVRNLKEQSILLVNQVAASLPVNAQAGDLNKKILEILMSQPSGPIHELVLKALNEEAKILMR